MFFSFLLPRIREPDDRGGLNGQHFRCVRSGQADSLGGAPSASSSAIPVANAADGGPGAGSAAVFYRTKQLFWHVGAFKFSLFCPFLYLVPLELAHLAIA